LVGKIVRGRPVSTLPTPRVCRLKTTSENRISKSLKYSRSSFIYFAKSGIFKQSLKSLLIGATKKTRVDFADKTRYANSY